MFDIFDLLTITWRFFQSFDHQSGSRWNDVYLCLTILNSCFSFYKLWRKKHVNLMAKWWMRTIISIEI